MWCRRGRLGVSGLFRADLPVYEGTQRIVRTTGEKVLNDASGLSATPIHKHLTLTEDADDALAGVIRRELAEAKAEGRHINVGAARHSMGGQAIPRNGVALTFDNGAVEIDSSRQTYLTHAGARWSNVIAALDPAGFSPKVMQSNNDFGIAATYSVNAHGWPFCPWGRRRSCGWYAIGGFVDVLTKPECRSVQPRHGWLRADQVIVDLEVEMV